MDFLINGLGEAKNSHHIASVSFFPSIYEHMFFPGIDIHADGICAALVARQVLETQAHLLRLGWSGCLVGCLVEFEIAEESQVNQRSPLAGVGATDPPA